METVYELARNRAFIANVQKATLTTEEFGIEPRHGLFGSQEWWKNVHSKVLPTHHLSGTITRIYMGSQDDWPMFSMTTDPGEEHSWTRDANTDEQFALYKVGTRVEVDYVIERFRRPTPGYDLMDAKIVVAIRVE